MPGQADCIPAECVGLDYFRAGLQVFMMDAANQVGLRAIKLVVASVDEDSFGVQKGAHGAVAQYRALLQAFYKVSRHSQQEYRSLPSFAASAPTAPSGKLAVPLCYNHGFHQRN